MRRRMAETAFEVISRCLAMSISSRVAGTGGGAVFSGALYLRAHEAVRCLATLLEEGGALVDWQPPGWSRLQVVASGGQSRNFA